MTMGTFKCFLEKNSKNMTYKLNLKVVDDLEEKIIIGNDFLIKNSVNINLNKRIITIDNYSLIFNCQNTSDNITLKRFKPIDFKNIYPNKKLTTLLDTYTSNINESESIIDVEFEIPRKNNVTPELNPYPCPQFQEKLMKDEINELLKKKIIQRSTSLFAAPCFIKKKEDGTGRLLIDYRNLNKLSVPMQYYFPYFF
ncbi:Transposon Tf2-9 polyprotein [Dictyocoela muelleri]|nr:Transposon Tf2-9 polyprotein [Dictyocoela muelleri]